MSPFESKTSSEKGISHSIFSNFTKSIEVIEGGLSPFRNLKKNHFQVEIRCGSVIGQFFIVCTCTSSPLDQCNNDGYMSTFPIEIPVKFRRNLPMEIAVRTKTPPTKPPIAPFIFIPLFIQFLLCFTLHFSRILAIVFELRNQLNKRNWISIYCPLFFLKDIFHMSSKS